MIKVVHFMLCIFCYSKKKKERKKDSSPGRVTRLVGASSCATHAPKGGGFGSLSGHILGLLNRPPVWGVGVQETVE